MNCYINSVNNVYSKLNDCIILGLTGRTGSGCSTTAQILSTKSFDELNLSSPKQRDFQDLEERKDAIVYKYLRKNWIPFVVIEASSIILSFVFEKSYEDFRNFITGLLIENNEHNFRINGNEELLKKLEGIRFAFGNNKFSNIDTDLLNILNNTEKTEQYYKYYTETLKKYKDSFYSIFKDYSCFESAKSNFNKTAENKSHLYTFLMQLFGNNLRSSSNAYNSTFNEQSFFTVAERINNVIKIICKHNNNNAVQTRICIDALRNPYEAHYLRDIYKSFYLISVSTDDDERRRRLSHLDSNELVSLDAMEYPQKECQQGQIFFQQSIAECLQISDIHLYNPHSKNRRYSFLVRSLARYISLVLHPGLVTPTNVERCMQTAFIAKLNSGCLSRQVGAVITDENYYIKAIGWNDVPQGQIPCNLRSIQNFFTENDSNTHSDFELENLEFTSALKRISKAYEHNNNIHETRNISYCFKDIYNGIKQDKNQVYTRALHAEENAFLQASKFGGEGIEGGKLFVTASPCELCSKKSYQLGIKEIFYIDPYPGIASSHILKLGKSNLNPKLNLFYGAIGNAYVSLYMQRFSYKDELQLSSGINMKELATHKSKIKQPRYDDFVNKNVCLELIFHSRNEVELIRKAKILSQKEEIYEIQKAFSWTGSTYEKTIPNGNTNDFSIINEFCMEGINYYTIKPKQAIRKGTEFEYEVKTIVRDECEIMRPILSYHIKNLTEDLKMSIKFKKDIFNEENEISNVVMNIYADINDNIVFDSNMIDKNQTDDYLEYAISFKKPYLFYTYSIEWNF